MCTAGITENGEWVRIYPIPFRTLEQYNKFKKFTWIEAHISKDSSDPRPESHRINTSTINLLEHVEPNKDWGRRRHFILRNSKVYTNLSFIIDAAKENNMSLCTFKPTKFIDIIIEKNQKPEPTKEEEIAFNNANRSLFDDESCKVQFTGMPHIPYKFKIQFEDDTGVISSMSIIDWEIPQLYLSCRIKDEEIVAIKKVKDKLINYTKKNDLHLFLGTMKQMHIRKSKNPYTIIGLFYPPFTKTYQPSLFETGLI